MLSMHTSVDALEHDLGAALVDRDEVVDDFREVAVDVRGLERAARGSAMPPEIVHSRLFGAERSSDMNTFPVGTLAYEKS